MTESILELDQEDIAARLAADEVLAPIAPVILQRRGITENDVQVAMAAMQPGRTTLGSVLIVLMPRLTPLDPDAPGPRSYVEYTVQVIDYPLARRQASGGTLTSAEQLADRVREIIHRFAPGRGQTIFFAGQVPVQVPVGRVSYGVKFRCMQVDQTPPSCATCGISPTSGTGPLSVTLSNQTAGAAIYYSVDGSYPSSVGAAATPPTSFLYSVPFTAPAAALVRAVASKSGYQDGNAAQVQYS